jgi:hypothetical protein
MEGPHSASIRSLRSSSLQAKALYLAGARVILSGRRQAELERVKAGCIEQGSAARMPKKDFKDPLILPLDLRCRLTHSG